MTGQSGRAGAVLSRFPCHLEAGDDGKRFGAVVGGVATELDVVGHQVGQVRRSHRLAEAPTTLDLLRLCALHGFGEADLEPLGLRYRALANADPDDLAGLAQLTALAEVDLAAAEPASVLESLRQLTTFTAHLDRQRQTMADLIAVGGQGNATSKTLLAATAAMLGFEVVDVEHSDDRWWHVATCRDRVVPAVAGLEPGPEVIAVEENPFVDATITPTLRRHTDRFEVVRGGLEEVVVTAVVVGHGQRTVAPLVVNIDTGDGLFFDGVVPDGEELAFEYSGQVTLGGVDVTGRAVGFQGGVFAASEASHPLDFVFADATQTNPSEVDDRVATFVTTSIVDGFDPGASLPHGGGVVPALPMAVGRSRWAFFIRGAHFGSTSDAAVPSFGSGLFDESVLLDAMNLLDPSALIGFRWEEREPFAVRVHLPTRLNHLDDETGSIVRQPIRQLLDRYRAAGIRLTTTYADARWVLGSGYARNDEAIESLGFGIGGTELWPDGTPQPASP